MPFKNKEENKEYQRQYYLKNKQKLLDKQKKYNNDNKEKINEKMKKYYNENKKDRLEYSKTENGRKSCRINNWKNRGVISDDYDKLYDYYLSIDNCENCGIELCEGIYGNNKKCLDHDHETGLFRNILCNTCNILRK